MFNHYRRLYLLSFKDMLKIDTLDALGDAITTIFTMILTTNHLPNKCQDIQQICPKYPKFVPKLDQRNAHNMPKLCQKYC